MITPGSSTGDRGRGGRPRNYLAGEERHRLFLRVVPPALVLLLLAGWIERAWFDRATEPTPPPIDTVLARNPAAPAVTDSVRISDHGPDTEIDPDPITTAPESPASAARASAAPLGAGRAALARVRDDTLFRSDDEPA